MKTFFFLVIMAIFVCCLVQKTTNEPEQETDRYTKRMMIIENHLTGKIDTFWFDESRDHNYIIKDGSLKTQIEVDSLDSLRFENN